MNIIQFDGLELKKQVIAKSWCPEIEDSAMKQIKNLCSLPFAFSHIAVMPDCHSGYGMPIGGVLATEGVVIPNAVGVDIGCGMCAVKTSLKVEQLDKETLKKIMGKIREIIPVGFDRHEEEQDKDLMPTWNVNEFKNEHFYKTVGGDWLVVGRTFPVISKEYGSALKQIGTLGGGNHFIEIQKDTNNNVWIMIHSGSRNLGYKVAQYYNNIAKELNNRWYSSVSKEWDLAFLPIESQEAKDYMTEMQYCVDFALANRKWMMDTILGILDVEFNFTFSDESMINIAHNYAAWEHHFGKNVIVHRKGATLAREGTIGIIPGSQGSKSYIVKGLGNKESFESCSHGAGRRLGRKQAQRELKLEDEAKKLDEQGIIHSVRNVSDLDEAAGAYKNIDEVMKNQSELVEILVELKPLAVIKGN